MVIFKKPLERMGLPSEAAGDCRIIVLEERLEIENHRGILDFSGNSLTAARIRGHIIVRGSNLRLCYLSRRLIVLRGQISSVEME